MTMKADIVIATLIENYTTHAATVLFLDRHLLSQPVLCVAVLQTLHPVVVHGLCDEWFGIFLVVEDLDAEIHFMQ